MFLSCRSLVIYVHLTDTGPKVVVFQTPESGHGTVGAPGEVVIRI